MSAEIGNEDYRGRVIRTIGWNISGRMQFSADIADEDGGIVESTGWFDVADQAVAEAKRIIVFWL